VISSTQQDNGLELRNIVRDRMPTQKFLSNMLKGLKERGVVYEEKAEKLNK
jgi:hypothetical protein